MYTHIFARGFRRSSGFRQRWLPQQGIRLFEPIVGGCPALTATPGLGTFFTYFNQLWPWLIGTSAGIALLMALVGGLQVILSGGSVEASGGLDRLKNAFLGLLMLAFAGLILTTLNPSFFKGGAVGAPGC